MNPPLKLRHGDTLATLYDKFNAVIDYLARTRIVAGSGIRVSQLPAGQTIESTAIAAGSSATAPAQAGGMFRVSEDLSAGTVTITGGLCLLSSKLFEGPLSVDGDTLPRGNNIIAYVVLTYTGGGDLSFEITSGINTAYVPGTKLCWPLARLSYSNNPLVQLWQGGMIDFTTKYLVS